MALHVPPKLAASLIHAFYGPWCASMRLTQINREPLDKLIAAGQPFILPLWHNEMFALIFLKKMIRLMTVASQSQDGAYITGVLEHLGFFVARGSSSRGGVSALLSCIHHMRNDKLSPAVTIDGPRGPRHKVKDGVLFLAHHTKAPIIPVRAFPDHSIKFKSWDRFELPLPFSKVRVAFADPYVIDRKKLDAEALVEERAKLERIMHDLEQA